MTTETTSISIKLLLFWVGQAWIHQRGGGEGSFGERVIIELRVKSGRERGICNGYLSTNSGNVG